MKSVRAYYLLLLYLTIMVKPLLPLAADWWSHEFNYVEHMLLIHARYGADHAQIEVAKSSATTDQPATQHGADITTVTPHSSPAVFNLHVNILSVKIAWPFIIAAANGLPPSPIAPPPRLFC